MRILHYFLGFDRAGGLNRYVSDLAFSQIQSGHTVFALYPRGSFHFLFSNKAFIKKKDRIKGIQVYVLLNGKIISLLEGIKNPQTILSSDHIVDDSNLNAFYSQVKPDILHVHTWMGFPKELLLFLKEKGCRVVYSTHDYFGICPKVNMIKYDGLLCQQPCNEECSKCNSNAPNEFFLAFRNLSFIFRYKRFLNPIVKRIRRNVVVSNNKCSSQHVFDYNSLRDYYRKLWMMCDLILFNSTITHNVFSLFLPGLKGSVISITHQDIQDRRELKPISNNHINLCYIGSLESYKGFSVLKSVLQDLYQQNIRNWHLDVWGTNLLKQDEDVPTIHYHGFFSQTDESRVFQDIDLLIVPSIWYETFGFIVLEALSHGVPVLCSDTVGAQSLLSPKMIYHGKEVLKKKLSFLLTSPNILENERKSIVSSSVPILTLSDHANTIEKLYLKLLFN